jgi:hypothetical protein
MVKELLFPEALKKPFVTDTLPVLSMALVLLLPASVVVPAKLKGVLDGT